MTSPQVTIDKREGVQKDFDEIIQVRKQNNLENNLIDLEGK